MVMAKSQSTRINDHFLVCQEIFEYMKKHDLVEKYSLFFAKFFEHCIKIALSYAKNQRESLVIAHSVWSNINIITDSGIIEALERKRYNYIMKWGGYSFFEMIFSIKRRVYGKKVLTICGVQFPLKSPV
jgi:hypothetical protein